MDRRRLAGMRHRSQTGARRSAPPNLDRFVHAGEAPAVHVDALTSNLVAPMMSIMRTTLTIDDDLAGLLQRRARETGLSFKETVNRAIRAGLGQAALPHAGAAPKTIPHAFGFRPGIDTDKLGQLADELEAEAFAATASTHDPTRRKRPRSRP